MFLRSINPPCVCLSSSRPYVCLWCPRQILTPDRDSTRVQDRPELGPPPEYCICQLHWILSHGISWSLVEHYNAPFPGQGAGVCTACVGEWSQQPLVPQLQRVRIFLDSVSIQVRFDAEASVGSTTIQSEVEGPFATTNTEDDITDLRVRISRPRGRENVPIHPFSGEEIGFTRIEWQGDPEDTPIRQSDRPCPICGALADQTCACEN